MRHRDAAPAGIARGIGERVELLQVDVAKAGLLRQLARRRVLDALLHADAPAGERPFALERGALHPQEQQLQPTFQHREHGDVDGHAHHSLDDHGFSPMMTALVAGHGKGVPESSVSSAWPS